MRTVKINGPEDLTPENLAIFDSMVDKMDKEFYSKLSSSDENMESESTCDYEPFDTFIKRIYEQYGNAKVND